ncbi:MAG: ankyrin repeat domain-containing protein [Candidatus Micrarchaeaceae archaeon]
MPFFEKKKQNPVNKPLQVDIELLKAVEYGMPNGVARAINEGANVNLVDSNGNPVLLTAFSNLLKHIEEIEQQRIDQDFLRSGPIHFNPASGIFASYSDEMATEFINGDLARLFNEHLKDIDSRQYKFAYIPAEDLAAVIKRLLAAGADINATDANGLGVLHKVYSSSSLTKFAIDSGAKVNAETKRKNTALMFAAQSSRYSKDAYLSMQYLIDAGAHVNAQNADGISALMVGAFTCSVDGVELLLAYGADKRLRDSRGRTAYDYNNGNGTTISDGPIPSNPKDRKVFEDADRILYSAPNDSPHGSAERERIRALLR